MLTKGKTQVDPSRVGMALTSLLRVSSLAQTRMTSAPKLRPLVAIVDADGERWRVVRTLEDGRLLVRRGRDGRIGTVPAIGGE